MLECLLFVGPQMSLRVSTAIVGELLEALFLLRSCRLHALPQKNSTKPKQLAQSDLLPIPESPAVEAAKDLVRAIVLEATEIETSTSPSLPSESQNGSAVIHPVSSAVSGSTIAAAGAKKLHPRYEIGTALEGRDLRRIDLAGSRITFSVNRSDLSGASFVGTFFAHCTFNVSSLYGAEISGAKFSSCTFVGTSAVGVVARCSHFSHCIFQRADLRQWDSSGATFFRCSFTLCDMSQWKVDGQTTIISPIDWARCRRLDWIMHPGSRVRECRVVNENGSAEHALSLPPREGPRSSCWNG